MTRPDERYPFCFTCGTKHHGAMSCPPKSEWPEQRSTPDAALDEAAAGFPEKIWIDQYETWWLDKPDDERLTICEFVRGDLYDRRCDETPLLPACTCPVVGVLIGDTVTVQPEASCAVHGLVSELHRMSRDCFDHREREIAGRAAVRIEELL